MNTIAFTPDPRARVAGTIEVPTALFQQRPDHPCQRVTELHAGTLLVRGVLDHNLDIHRFVDVFVQLDQHGLAMDEALKMPLPELLELSYKANGHTRGLLWREDRTAAPDTVRVTVHLIEDEDTSVRVYNSFDSSDSSKRSNDQIQSAMKLAGVEVKNFIRSGSGLKTALGYCMDILYGGAEPKTAKLRGVNRIVAGLAPRTLEARLDELVPILPTMRRFKDAIELFDATDAAPKRTPIAPAFLGGYLSILHRDSERGLEFMNELVASKGEQLNDEMDAVFAIRYVESHINEMRSEPEPRRKARMELACVLNAYSAWLDGRMFPVGSYPLSERIFSTFNPALRPPRQSKARANRKAEGERQTA